MAEQKIISEKSRRVAKNTLLLYFRMLLLLFVGLFTSRIVLQNLGITDYGVYNAVAGLVTLFTVVVNGLSSAITRFITCAIGNGDIPKARDLFASSLSIQLVFCATILILAETLGIWFLHNHMVIPCGRENAAFWVLQCATGILIFNLLSIPYTATILAHEQMKAYAVISILEAILKLSVAVSIMFSKTDKLKVYAFLMLVAAAIVRTTYVIYCRRHFEETCTGPRWSKNTALEMTGFAGWNALSSGLFMVNTQGLNILTNIFFGVTANAARGVAAQVEGIVKQFVNNVIVAINPQITKSYSAGDKAYSFSLVGKGAKYAYLIMLCFIAPALFEMQTVLELWLGTVPEQAALFTKLTLICTLLDLLMTTFSTEILADGRIRKYYIGICSVSVVIFPVTWIAFRAGAPAQAAYLVFISLYIVMDVIKLIFLHNITGYPYAAFVHDVLLKIAAPTVITIASCYIIRILIPEETVPRMLITAAASCCAWALSTYRFALTEGERSYVKSKIKF